MENIKRELIEAMRDQNNMTLTEGARKNANEVVKAIMTGRAKKAIEKFDF